MASTAKKNQKKRTLNKSIAISKNVKSYEKTPLFAKKAKAMEAILKEHGLPRSQPHG